MDEQLFETSGELQPERAPRRRDYAYEALAEVCGLDWDVDRGRLNDALGIIREREPDYASIDNAFELGVLIRGRAKMYEQVMGDAMLTPNALAKHWDALPGQVPKPAAVNAPPSYPDGICQTCNGDKLVFVGTRPSDNPASGHDQYAPCPDCNSGTSTDFWRHDGSRFRGMDPATVRERMRG